MKWIEMIELRSAEGNWELLESQLQKLLQQVEKETYKQPIKAYRRVMMGTDVSIHLLHDSQNVEPEGSLLGVCLASNLKEFGLVNHSIWIEMNSEL